MNQSNKTNQESVNAIQNTILTTIDKLYNYGFAPREVSFILFILILLRDGFFNQYKSYDKNLAKVQQVEYSKKLRKDIKLHIESLPDKYNLKIVLDVYSSILARLEENLYIIIQYLNEHIDTKLLQENFSEIFDTILNKLVVSQGKYGYLIIQPLELTRLIISLAQLPKGATVYNPFAGCASFGVFLGDGYRYTGQEYSSNTWAIGYLRLLAYEKRNGNEFQFSDSIEYWNPKNEKYDFIVAHPPFGVRFLKPKIGRFGGIKNSEHFFIEKGIEDLTSDGKLIAVISNDILFRKGPEYDLRKYLIENDLIEMLISFPRGLLLYTMTPFSVIVINKKKKQKGVIQFVDAENFIERISKREKRIKEMELFSFIMEKKETDKMRIVGNDEVAQDDFNLSVQRYLQKKNEGLLLNEVASFIQGERAIEGQKGLFIKIKDLKNDKLKFKLETNNLEEIEIPKTAKKIGKSCLLLAARWKTLKPTYFEFTGNPIFITPDCIALEIDESKIMIKYLIHELHSNSVNEQVESLRLPSGSVIPFIRKDDLLRVKIDLPSIKEQEARVKRVIQALAEEKRRENNLFNKIHGLENELIEQNTHLRHTLTAPSTTLKTTFSYVKEIILQKIQPKFPGLMDLKVTEDHKFSFGEYLTSIESDILRIAKIVENQLTVESYIYSKDLVSIEIIDFLSRFTNKYKETKDLINFLINFDFDKENFSDIDGERIKIFILGNADLLSDMLDNLIDNAVKHAFNSDKQKNKIKISLMTSLNDNSDNEICITVSNTGKPFPNDFKKEQFIRKGIKAGKNSGDGFGGFYINEIIKHLNGNFEIFNDVDNSDFTTHFEINFPIFGTNEDEYEYEENI
ncbi:MAG: N-6 DNA methylase [Leptospiraceae bacterium]|nr:N-6 DNA methylase [Leptospiraceae bacterium]